MDMPDWGWGEISAAILVVGGVICTAFKLVPWDTLASWTTGRKTRSIDFVAQRIEPVERFNQLLFEFHDRLTGIFGIWGPDAPYDELTRRKAMDVYHAYRRDLSSLGIAAREAARRIDPELEQRVRAMEAESANLVAMLDTTPAHTQMQFFIERNDKALALQQRVADRIKELLR